MSNCGISNTEIDQYIRSLVVPVMLTDDQVRELRDEHYRYDTHLGVWFELSVEAAERDGDMDKHDRLVDEFWRDVERLAEGEGYDATHEGVRNRVRDGSRAGSSPADRASGGARLRASADRGGDLGGVGVSASSDIGGQALPADAVSSRVGFTSGTQAFKRCDPRYTPGISQHDDDMTDAEWFQAMGPRPAINHDPQPWRNGLGHRFADGGYRGYDSDGRFRRYLAPRPEFAVLDNPILADFRRLVNETIDTGKYGTQSPEQARWWCTLLADPSEVNRSFSGFDYPYTDAQHAHARRVLQKLAAVYA